MRGTEIEELLRKILEDVENIKKELKKHGLFKKESKTFNPEEGKETR